METHLEVPGTSPSSSRLRPRSVNTRRVVRRRSQTRIGDENGSRHHAEGAGSNSDRRRQRNPCPVAPTTAVAHLPASTYWHAPTVGFRRSRPPPNAISPFTTPSNTSRRTGPDSTPAASQRRSRRPACAVAQVGQSVPILEHPVSGIAFDEPTMLAGATEARLR